MKNNIFGTDGIRATMGSEPFTITSLIKLGSAIAHWASTKYGTSPSILLGHDTRESCSLVKAALQSGMLLYPIRMYDTQVVPTPAICQITKYANFFDLGIVISASHNPYQDNGIKLIASGSGKLNLEDELAISELFYSPIAAREKYSSLGSACFWSQAEEYYLKTITTYFEPCFLKKQKNSTRLCQWRNLSRRSKNI